MHAAPEGFWTLMLIAVPAHYPILTAVWSRMPAPSASWILRRGSLLLVQVGIVTLCVAVTTVFAVRVQEAQFHRNTVERVTDVAESLAVLPDVVTMIGQPQAASALQPIAELVRAASGVDYVVITDADGRRLTHPNAALIGEIVSTDASAVLNGETFVGTEVGTLGLSVRAKVPVLRNGEVIGTASVGLLSSHIDDDLEATVLALAPWVLGSLIFGFLAATGIDVVIGRRVTRYESELRELAVQRRLAAVLRDHTHEFTNRLHVVYGLVESGSRTEALDYIGSVARVDTVPAELDVLPIDPRLRAVLAAPAAMLREHGGELRVTLAPDNTAGPIGDDELTVSGNLVANAVDAVQDAMTGHVDVDLHITAKQFALTVSDNGPGVSPHTRARMFEHGFSTKRRERMAGVDIPRGIGLALVREVVHRRGGILDVGTSSAGGARFAVTLPVSGGDS